MHAKAEHGKVPGEYGVGGERCAKLSIAALTVTRQVPALLAMRDRMRAAGKAPKTILITAAQQLLVIIVAMIRNHQPIRL
mgnify:CR=1 FL=1